MKASEIKTGCYYTAKVSGQIVTVRVDEIGTRNVYRRGKYRGEPSVRAVVAYYVTSMRTGWELVFKSARKFREQVGPPFDPPF